MTKVRIPTNVHNTFREVDDGEQSNINNANPVVTPFMVPLITALLKRKPRWEFVAHGYAREWYTMFKVYEDGVELGWIDRTIMYKDGRNIEQFQYSNVRVQARRRRNGAAATKDLNKAVKGIITDFYKPTVAERVNEARITASRLGTQLCGTNANRQRTLHSEATMRVLAYARAHPGVLNDELRTLIEDLQEAEVATKASEPLTSWILADDSRRTKALVVVDGDTYHIQTHADGETVQTALPASDVPRTIMQNVAFLKLVNDGEVVPGVGIRIHAGAFAVLLTKEEGETP